MKGTAGPLVAMAEPPKPFTTRRRGNVAKGWRVARVPDSSFCQNLLCEYIFSKLYLVYTPKERSKEAGSQESGAEVGKMSSSASSIVFESPVRSGFLLPKQWTETGTGLYQFKDCKRLH